MAPVILPPFGRFANPKQLSYQKRCDELCFGNLYLAMSFKIYVHLPEDVANHKRHFKSHRDVHNPAPSSPNDIFFTAWDTWFEPLLNSRMHINKGGGLNIPLDVENYKCPLTTKFAEQQYTSQTNDLIDSIHTRKVANSIRGIKWENSTK